MYEGMVQDARASRPRERHGRRSGIKLKYLVAQLAECTFIRRRESSGPEIAKDQYSRLVTVTPRGPPARHEHPGDTARSSSLE